MVLHLLFGAASQRFALPACGRAWIRFGSRKNSKRGKCSKMPQNPTRQVHALLGGFLPEDYFAINYSLCFHAFAFFVAHKRIFNIKMLNNDLC
jgi:hypothetical protein